MLPGCSISIVGPWIGGEESPVGDVMPPFEVSASIDFSCDDQDRITKLVEAVPESPRTCDRQEFAAKASWTVPTFADAVALRARLDALPFVTRTALREM